MHIFANIKCQFSMLTFASGSLVSFELHFFYFSFLYSSPQSQNETFLLFLCAHLNRNHKCLQQCNSVHKFIITHNRRNGLFYGNTMALWQLLSPLSSPPHPKQNKKLLKRTSQNVQELSLLLIVMRRRPLPCASWEMREVS